MRYWVPEKGRQPQKNEIEPLIRAFWEARERVFDADYLAAVQELQRFSRVVARFLTTVDRWLTPTMSTPPPLGVMVSTSDDPRRSLVSGQSVRYAGVVANLTGNPAMSVPLWWNAEDLPIGVHFLGRYGDEPTLLQLAAQLEQARPWAQRLPPLHAAGALARQPLATK